MIRDLLSHESVRDCQFVQRTECPFLDGKKAIICNYRNKTECIAWKHANSKGGRMKQTVVIIKADGTQSSNVLDKEASLEEMQKWVGGYIETVGVSYRGKRQIMVVNEDGKLMGLPSNDRASEIAEMPIVGDVAIVDHMN